MFTILKKIVKNLNLSWVTDSGKETEKKHERTLTGCTVVWVNALTVDALMSFVKAKDMKKLANIVRNFNAKVLYHDASDDHKSLAVKVARGEKERSELDSWTYTHDYDAEPRERESKEVKQAKALAESTPEELAIIMALAEKLRAEKAKKEAEAKKAAGNK
jgi:hypothetical protein